MCWLLEEQGYRLLLKSYRHDGPVREKASGERQFGVDLVASRRGGAAEGKDALYLFSLKMGNLGSAQWVTGKGTLRRDLEWMLDLSADRFRVLMASAKPADSVHVVGVVNGEIRRKELRDHIEDLEQSFLRRDRTLELWDVENLVDQVEQLLDKLGTDVASSVFPPAIRPYAERILPTAEAPSQGTPPFFRVSNQPGKYEIENLDLLLETCLPLGRQVERDAQRFLVLTEPIDSPSSLRLHRALTELILLVGMLRLELERFGDRPLSLFFNVTERVLCRAFEMLRRLADDLDSNRRSAFRNSVKTLVALYRDTALLLAERLGPTLSLQGGLSLRNLSERLDYSYRVLQLSGYLAAGGLAALDLQDIEGAELLALTLEKAWKLNDDAVDQPFLDDQIIEYALVFELWMRTGRSALVGQHAARLVQNYALRIRLNQPLPGLYISAGPQLEPLQLRTVASAYSPHGQGDGEAPAEWEDGSSTLFSLAAFLAVELGELPTEEFEQHFPKRDSLSGDALGGFYPQSWRPFEEAAKEWYVWELRGTGDICVHYLNRGIDVFRQEFREFNNVNPHSPAKALKFPSVDRLAWKTWRTPPPMKIFVDLVDQNQ